jgi:hypothetical protein
MKINTIEDVVFNYIEFFFSKEELNTMFKIKPLSHHVWLDAIDGMYSIDPNESSADETEFHYNIMHTTAYKDIIKELKSIKKIIDVPNKKIDQIKRDIQPRYNKINEILRGDELYYYEQTYVYAHYIFSNIRNNGIKIKGGGIKHIKDIKDLSLEEFKELIKEKIKELE